VRHLQQRHNAGNLVKHGSSRLGRRVWFGWGCWHHGHPIASRSKSFVAILTCSRSSRLSSSSGRSFGLLFGREHGQQVPALPAP
jgi:hypothetical protein